MADFRHALLAMALLWSATALAAAPVPGSAVASAQDWSKTLGDWRARAERGEPEAPQHLCELYFDGRGGTFDAANTVAWCRRAADLGDARAMERMGLLSLAGIGTGKDLDTAARLCALAQPRDPAGSAAFCVAAVAEERQRLGEPLLPGAAAPAQDTTPAATISDWRDRADRGDRVALAHLCETYFGAHGGPFDPVRAAEWCRLAAGYGDAGAMRRLGMMRLWGVGMEKDTPQAEALCAAAQTRDPAVSGSFCVAAVRQERALAAAQATPSRVTHSGPGAVLPDRESLSTALGQDRAIESVHTTATGLHYNCRDIIRWSRYETREGVHIITSDTQAFGRPILQYQEKDYAELDRAATDCAAAMTPYDADGSQRSALAEFRTILPLMAARQRELEQQTKERRADMQRCIDAMRSSWTDAQQIVPAASDFRSDDIYSCTSAGNSQPISANSLPRAALPQPPAATVR